MNYLRKNRPAMLFFVLLFGLSTLLVSCDPEGYITQSILLDRKLDEEAAKMAELHPELDCKTIELYMERAKLVASRAAFAGTPVSQTQLMQSMIEFAQEQGDLSQSSIPSNELDQVMNQLESLQFVTTGNSILPLLSSMLEQGLISQEEYELFSTLDTRMRRVTTSSQASEVFTITRRDIKRSGGKREASMLEALDLIEQMVACETTVRTTAVAEKDFPDCIECISQTNWVRVVTYVLVSVFFILAAFIFFWLAPFVAMLLAVVSWVAVSVLYCWNACFGPAPCPSGQELTCHPFFSLVNGACVINNPAITDYFDGIFFTPRVSTSSPCPSGSSPLGFQCQWGDISGFDELRNSIGENDQGRLTHQPVCR